MKINKITIIMAVALMGATTMQAAPRTQQQMKQAAAKALNAQLSAAHKAPRRDMPVVLAEKQNITVMGYADGGFAIMANDDLLPEVLGFSTKTYEADQRNDGFQWWLSTMEEAVAYYINNNERARVVKPNPDKFQPEVRPMLSTEWGQEEPYNNECPVLPDAELLPRPTLVGCVATATSQILNYHQYPQTGHGTTTLLVPYGDPNGTNYFFDFSTCHFDWAHMRNTYTVGNYTAEEAQAVADLSHAMGMMAVMQYGHAASGAITDDAANGLREYFDITTATAYTRSDLMGFSELYTEEEWCDMLFNDLSNVGPVYYAGADANDQGGHAFVVDGYNADGLVHVNWGWYGRHDGYYNVSLLNPRVYQFSKAQEMILGIAPPSKAKGVTQNISVEEPGTLAQQIDAVQQMMGSSINISGLKVTGTLNADDLYKMANMPTLTDIDLSAANLVDNQLPAQAFYGCTNLRNLKLPLTMTSYGDGALANCSNLNSLTLPEDGDLDYVVEGGVVYTKDQSEVIAVLPTAADTVNIRSGVTAIHPQAFEGCKYVRVVYLPSSLKTIGDRAFANVLIMRELHVSGYTPATATATTFEGVDPGFLMLFLRAGSRAFYEEAEGWSQLFKSDNVKEVGTLIRARNLTRNYGEDVDEYYFEIIGERVYGLPQISCEATKTSPAGDYPIVVSRGTITADDVTYVNGTLTIVGGPVGVTEGGEATGITSSSITLPASPIYDLQGREVEKTSKGIYIQNNKKIMK